MSGADPSVEPLLDVRRLRVEFAGRYGPLAVLDDISIEIARGEVLGVVGESGAGKSLVGAAVVGLISPPGYLASGEIRIEGCRIDNLPPRELRRIRGRRIGTIIQDAMSALDPLYTVGKQIEETIRTHLGISRTRARARALELLQEVGMPLAERRIDQYPHQLSGGMRQRAVIAMALAAEPRLVIADEPTTALDCSIQAQVIALLLRICRDHGSAMMLISHDIGLMSGAADRIVVMYAGRIIEAGSAQQVVHRAKHPYTIGLMNSMPRVDRRRDRLEHIDGSMPRPDAIPSGCPFHPRCPKAMGRCAAERPALRPGAETRVACWLHTDAI